MRNLHQVIVDDVGQVVGRQRIGRFVEHLVVQRRSVYRHVAANQVVHPHLLVFGHFETDHPLVARGDAAFDLFVRQGQRRGQPGAHFVIVRERFAGCFGFRADRVQFVGRVESVISVARSDQLQGVFQVDLFALALAVRGVRASLVDAFVDRDAAPFERLHDIALRSRYESVRIGVFDAKDKVAAVLAREKVVVQRRADASHMQGAGRTRRKTDSDFFIARHIFRNCFCGMTMWTAHAAVCRDACRRPIPVRRGLHGFTPDRPPAKIGNLFERVLDREGFICYVVAGRPVRRGRFRETYFYPGWHNFYFCKL